MPTVELLYAANCPNVGEARSTLTGALAEAGLPPSWKERELSSPETPPHARGFGSPTVLVDGRDVAGAEPGDAACCRLYQAGDGRCSGVPPSELIVRALVTATTAQRPTRGMPARTLLVLPGAVLALVPSLTCPACWPAYVAVLSAFGLEFVRPRPI
jgi:mercuric ion transport protein